MYTNHSQIFSDAVTKLANRGWTQSLRKKGSPGCSCVYDGKGCAIGVLDGVKKYAKKWDGSETSNIEGIKQEFPSDFGEVFGPRVKVSFLAELQSCHDEYEGEEMKMEFRKLIWVWKLKIPLHIRALLD